MVGATLGRRRKIKCNYPPALPSAPTTTSEKDKKCIECATHNRTCQIQGFVASGQSTGDAAAAGDGGDSSTPAAAANLMPQSQQKSRIYKRRRPVDQTSPDQSDDEDNRPRMKLHIDMMESVVGRIAKEQDALNTRDAPGKQDRENGTALDFSRDLGMSSVGGILNGDSQFGLNIGNPFPNGLSFATEGVNGQRSTDFKSTGDGFETFLFPGSTLGDAAAAASAATQKSSTSSQQQHRSYPQSQDQPPPYPGPIARTLTGFDPSVPIEEQAKKSSPLLCQLFNNEIFSQAPPTTPQVLTQKVQTMTFSETATDAEKLLSSISDEPYLLEVLDISIKWWVSWRDQAFALQDVFAFYKDDQLEEEFGSTCCSSQGGSANTGACTDGSAPSTVTSSSKSSPSAGSAPKAYPDSQSITLRDFVTSKLSHTDDPVSLSTGLLCVALSLSQLRSGVDDSVLNISTTPAEIADRITLAVDTIVLSPSSKPEYARDPGVLLLLMMRSKMFAESNQLRKSWLSLRGAIDVARKIGFTEPRMLAGISGEYRSKMSEGELRRLFHRQRFVGSIMELDRMMSMVLGFPHAQDVKFTDRLAMAVLKGQQPSTGGSAGGSTAPASSDIKMRALRRVMAIVAGRVNDRNGSSDPDEVKHRITMEIQETINEAAAAMPEGWWDVASHIHYADPIVAHEHLVAQMWFWQVQAFLHLPFMLKPCPLKGSVNHHGDIDNPPPDPYVMSRYLCLQGCRGMVRVFNVLRSDPALAVYICACEDFQGVFSACILLVGSLIRLTFCSARETIPGSAAELMGDVDEDLALISEIKDVFRYRAIQQGGCISKQGLKVLEELSSFLYDDLGFNGDQPRRRTVVLPYFGAIHLELRPTRQPRCDLPNIETQGLSTAPDLTPPSSTEQSVEGAFESDFSVPNLPTSDWGTNSTSQFAAPEGNWNWDQFLFGNELAQNWEAEIPEWPADESLWEWS